MKKITPVVAVDIGNVCLNLDYQACADAAGVEDFWHMMMRHPRCMELEIAIESGMIENDTFLAEMSEILELSPQKIYKAWMAVVSDEMKGMSALIDKMIDAGLRPVFFSNISWAHWAYCQTAIPFAEKMTGAVLSCDVRAVKPHPPIYEYMESRFCRGGVPCLYLDDRADNIESGRARGWFSHHFTNAASAELVIDELIASLQTRITSWQTH